MSSIGGAGGYHANPYEDADKKASGGYAAVPGPSGQSGATPALPAAAPADAAPWSFSPLKPGAIDLGIGLGGLPGLGLELGLPKYDEQGSSQVKVLAESAKNGLFEAATKNTTGPEAKLLAFVKANEADALRSIEADEAKARKLPLDSPERRALEDRIDARVARFRNDLSLETRKTAGEIQARAGKKDGGSMLDRFKSMLPPYLRECVEKEGIVIPGVPGSFKPRTDNGTFGGPTGLDYKVEL